MKRQNNHITLTVDLIVRTVYGDHNALLEILKHYEPYISYLSRLVFLEGSVREEYIKDIKASIRQIYIENIGKWRWDYEPNDRSI